MQTYLDCWASAARALFSQALAGQPQLIESPDAESSLSGPTFVAEMSGDAAGRFTVSLDARIIELPLLGEGTDQTVAWKELLREVAESAAGDLLASSQLKCRIESFEQGQWHHGTSRTFLLDAGGLALQIAVQDELEMHGEETQSSSTAYDPRRTEARAAQGVDLLLDVELDASLRFGCREMPLSELLELGPGDVVELDRQVSDPVDLVVGDKIVARGDVVLVNGNFGLRVTEVAAPRNRLESIRCLF
jgi:flagellar motor switch protein FliN